MASAQSLILQYALPLVPFDGWSEYTLRQAAKEAKLTEADLHKAFPGGVKDCVDFFFREADKGLEQQFGNGAMDKMRVPERIETLVMARLARWLPYREAVRRAVALRALPWNALHGTQSLWRSADVMWRLAGDRSTDFNHYTKRMTLAGVYSATLLYWLNDALQDNENARAFLKRRLGDVGAFGKWKKEIQAKMKRRTA